MLTLFSAYFPTYIYQSKLKIILSISHNNAILTSEYYWEKPIIGTVCNAIPIKSTIWRVWMIGRIESRISGVALQRPQLCWLVATPECFRHTPPGANAPLCREF